MPSWASLRVDAIRAFVRDFIDATELNPAASKADLIAYLEAHDFDATLAFRAPVAVPPVIQCRPKHELVPQHHTESVSSFLRRCNNFFQAARIPELDRVALVLAGLNPACQSGANAIFESGATAWGTFQEQLLNRFCDSPTVSYAKFVGASLLDSEDLPTFADRLKVLFADFRRLTLAQLAQDAGADVILAAQFRHGLFGQLQGFVAEYLLEHEDPPFENVVQAAVQYERAHGRRTRTRNPPRNPGNLQHQPTPQPQSAARPFPGNGQLPPR
jgi:hypothetical protein